MPDTESDDSPLIETTTLENADVRIHGHPFGRLFVDVRTRYVECQIPADRVTLNGALIGSPDRAIDLEGVTATHDPRDRSVAIRL